MKKLVLSVLALVLLAGGIAAVLQSRGKPRKIHAFAVNRTTAAGTADGPTSILISIGFHRPYTLLSVVRRIAAGACHIAAACLCGPRKSFR